MNCDLQVLVSEYKNLNVIDGDLNWEQIEAKLIDHHEWSQEHAITIINLVREYGGFVLRNAAALAIACDHEDGELRI
jgi:hypothetical protein